MARLQKSSRTATKPAAPTTASVPDALTGVAAFGTGKTDAQMVRRSNLWRDNYNPLRGLVMSRLITIFEAAERGAIADLRHKAAAAAATAARSLIASNHGADADGALVEQAIAAL